MAGLAVAAFVAAVIFMPQVSLDRGDDQRLREEGKEFDKALREKKAAEKTAISKPVDPRKSTSEGSTGS
jgi:hypothetical protein